MRLRSPSVLPRLKRVNASRNLLFWVVQAAAQGTPQERVRFYAWPLQKGMLHLLTMFRHHFLLTLILLDLQGGCVAKRPHATSAALVTQHLLHWEARRVALEPVPWL